MRRTIKSFTSRLYPGVVFAKCYVCGLSPAINTLCVEASGRHSVHIWCAVCECGAKPFPEVFAPSLVAAVDQWMALQIQKILEE